MQHQSSLSVKDILNRDHFEKTKVIAGLEGLTRQVKWVHVVEVPNIKKLLNGNELILSTGVVWKENHKLLEDFLQQLIDCGAAGLCIEIGTYTSNIPDSVIQLANHNRFPIILFMQEVQFVNITQDIHAVLINQHYQTIQDLEQYSLKLNQKLLTIENSNEMLKLMHDYTGLQIIMKTNDEKDLFVPEMNSDTKRSDPYKLFPNDSPFVAKRPVIVMEKHFGELFILSTEREINEFDLLILDRTTTALAQLFLRELYVEEKRRTEKHEWITRWVDGEYGEQEALVNLAYYEGKMRVYGGTVAICKLPLEISSSDRTYLNLFIRSIFEQQGFHLITTERHGYTVYILLNLRGDGAWKHRLSTGMEKVLNTEFLKKHASQIDRIAVGQYTEALSKIGLSYQTASEALKLQKKKQSERLCTYYEDLHMYRVISLFKTQNEFQEMITEYLQPVIDYDEKYNGKLLQTLRTYLSCNGSKKETAKQLYVVRQTLYYRIEKLEKLLGEDFMSNAEKRLAIELMLFAHEHLNGGNHGQALKAEDEMMS
ncbi:PucR family transcriptional regulator [Pseudalkalibacillus berkeleyi]|uniref:PucR family transcriptional regulator ligand-binding domain-containing protein n=1 Tax=Pseudalkalibacillus berkeleyi TaxID=1069813 RepID=A0ABS9H0F9_9BACL|nr:PucR family transcriptional regulator [Pseudalkalibacillus berkeleyi]MCF6138477.1 PucR family transcriptional regulator ligand-binding domain-containing protein [Pseudalkalibacillus berkeleyi]